MIRFVIVMLVVALFGISVGESQARGGRRGGQMMNCNAQKEAAPKKADAKDVSQTPAMQIINPVDRVVAPASVMVAKTRSGLNLSKLAALSKPIPSTAGISQYAGN